MGWEIRLTDLERGGQTTRSFMQATVRIGRHTDNELVLKHNQISRLHLTLSREGDRYYAEDSSRNGTFLKAGDQWTRLAGRSELKLPAVLRLADWSARIDYQADDEWDKSVIIPAGHLVKRMEAILVFDLCESSRIAAENDHMAYHLKQRLMQIADPVLAEFGIRFLKGTGDGFLATFGAAQKALAAAVELRNRIQVRNARTTNPPIHFRIALHFGETWGISTGGQDIHGNDVNVTFRVEGVQRESFAAAVADFPRMDRILGTQALVDELRRPDERAVPPGTRLLGAAALKGIADPVTIYWFDLAPAA